MAIATMQLGPNLFHQYSRDNLTQLLTWKQELCDPYDKTTYYVRLRIENINIVFTEYSFMLLFLKMIFIASMPEYVSGWCGHGFESHSQPLLLTYPETDLSLWRSVFCFLRWCNIYLRLMNEKTKQTKTVVLQLKT